MRLAVVVVNKQSRRINRRRLARLARAVIAAECRRSADSCHRDAELTVVIGDDEWIRELNRKYLKRDAPTDVLAFPQEPKPGCFTRPAGSRPVLGDVAISADTAARQAEELGHALEEELAVLVTHGILHLTGWSDETPAQRRRMMRRVQELLVQAQQDLES